jgi:RNA recognition motif-containing protein
MTQCRWGTRENAPMATMIGRSKGVATYIVQTLIIDRYKNDANIDPEKAGRSIFIYNLSPNINKDDIDSFYGKFGTIEDIVLVKDIVTHYPKGYGFIVYKSEHSAYHAYKHGHSVYVKEAKSVKVDYVRAGNQPNFKPRRLGGGYGGKIYSGQLRFK